MRSQIFFLAFSIFVKYTESDGVAKLSNLFESGKKAEFCFVSLFRSDKKVYFSRH